MKYGGFLPLFGEFADASRVVDIAVEAERAGWDGLFVSDLAEYGDAVPVADACIALAAISSITKRLRLGLVTPVADRRRPWVLARQSAVLDHLTHGRLIFATGLGYASWHENLALPAGRAAHDEEEDARASLFDESLAVLLQCWSGRPVRHEGKWMQVDSAPFLPTPLQTPRVPVWVSAEWPRRTPLRRAAHLDGILPVFADQRGSDALPSTADVRDIKDELRRLGAAPEHDLVLRGSLGPRWAEADLERLHQLENAGATWWLETVRADESVSAVFDRMAAGPPRRP
ncbi:MAG: LLM class flavin-dependent oxidoreductase [Acidimicrobiales bacterium]|jgi:alkanesulfonate monooxygenase SsuD/methylene tetrahydromethanopterin reductase-like flavin-dependent oxidoreductase (luciferase family)